MPLLPEAHTYTSMETRWVPSETPGHQRAAGDIYVLNVSKAYTLEPKPSETVHVMLDEDEMLRTVTAWLSELTTRRRVGQHPAPRPTP